MTPEQIVVWIIVGGIAGLLAEALVRSVHLGLVGAVLVGMAGAFICGWLFSLLHLRIGSGFGAEVLTAFVGAVLLLLLLSGLRRS